MASDITLSKGVRQNLLSLQSTADLLNRTQERLATGKKVNSALDGPINFFTSQSLSSRANDLSRLLDSVSNAVQTVEAADEGITAISKLIENAQAVARQALTAGAASTTYELTIEGSATLADDAAASVDTDDLSSLDATGGTITINGTDVVIAADDGEAEALQALSDAATANGTFSVTDNGDGTFTIEANEGVDLVIGGDATTLGELGLSADTTYANADIGDVTGDLEITHGGETVSITFGEDDSAGEVNSVTELTAALADLGLTGVTASVEDGVVTITSNVAGDVTIGGDAGVLTALGLDADDYTPEAEITPDATRTSLQADFNNLLTQISELAGDASFNGVNLLNGDDLTVVFNEDGSSTLDIEGVDFSASGLGLTALSGSEFQDNAGVNASIAQLDAATSTLRAQATKFGSNLSIVQTRQDFTKNMISVLQVGSDNLVLADTNEEGANMLALNTRQQLSTVALSLAAQADQNVLRLF